MSSPANQPMEVGACLDVPAHAQDCTGYCGPGCVTMIYDAFNLLGDTIGTGFKQVDGYKSVYKANPTGGFPDGKGPFDAWHTSPLQLELLLNQQLPYKLIQKVIAPDMSAQESNEIIAGLLGLIRESLDRRHPSIMLLAYDETSETPHATGTHWVVVRGYTVLNNAVSGYFTLDPWRRWQNVKGREDVDHEHLKSPKVSNASQDPSNNLPSLPDPTQPAPQVVASWHRDPAHFPSEEVEATAESLTQNGEDMAANLFRGIRTDGTACILTLSPDADIDQKVKRGRPLPARTAEVPSSWPPWLKSALAGADPVIPLEFAHALPVWPAEWAADFSEIPSLVVHRPDRPGQGYRLIIWPLQDQGLRLVAWVTGDPQAQGGPRVEGISVVRDWPALRKPQEPLNDFAVTFPPEDTDWPERIVFWNRVKQLFPPISPAPVVHRLVWEPCPLSMSPALPFYDVRLRLPAFGDLAQEDVIVLITPDGHLFETVARGSKAGG